MTILITGSSGFLGKHLKNILIENKKSFITVSRKNFKKNNEILSSSLKDKNIIKKYRDKIDIVIHLANKYDYGSSTCDDEIFKANFLYGINVFNFSKKIEAKIFINISSTLAPNINRYAYSKKIFKEYLSFFNNKSIKVINLNLDMMFGYQDKRFFHNLIQTTFLKNKVMKMTNGKQKRNISHVSNVVQQIFYVINNHYKINKIYLNLGSNFQVTIKEFVKIISICIKKKTGTSIDNKILFGQIIRRDRERLVNKHISSNFFKKNNYINRTDYLSDLRRFVEIELEKYFKKIKN